MSDNPSRDEPRKQSAEQGEPKVRKDGRPFKEGNLRENGSYDIGKYRPPVEHQFRAGDGRTRGKRPKGTKNLSVIWAKKLKQKIRIDGKEQTAAEWLVEGMIRRGISKSDRAAETALMEASQLDTSRENHLGKTDSEIMEAWLAQRLADVGIQMSDDFDIHRPDDKPMEDTQAEEGQDAGQ